MTGLLPLAAELSPAAEGLRIITGMLIVGVIFAAIVVVGEWIHYLRYFRRRY